MASKLYILNRAKRKIAFDSKAQIQPQGYN